MLSIYVDLVFEKCVRASFALISLARLLRICLLFFVAHFDLYWLCKWACISVNNGNWWFMLVLVTIKQKYAVN